MRKANMFEKGFLCAVSAIYHGHGGSVEIDDALRTIGADKIRPSSISEFDRPMLVQFQKDGYTH